MTQTTNIHPPKSKLRIQKVFSHAKELKGQDPVILTLFSLLAALILFSYALVRGPSESLFLKAHDNSLNPGLWIEVGLSVIVLVSIYNRALRRFNLTQLFQVSIWISIITLCFLQTGQLFSAPQEISVFNLQFPISQQAALRIWSDLYIVLLVESFWSLANQHFPLKSARFLYGILCILGTFGSMLGNLLVANYAKDWGSETLISMAIPALILLSLVLVPLSIKLKRLSGTDESTQTVVPNQSPQNSSLSEGLRIIWHSRYLTPLLFMVLLSQISITLIDYQYNAFLQDTFIDVEQRSSINAYVYLSIDVGALVFQLLSGAVIVLLGVGSTLLAIPSILFIFCLFPIFSPMFWAIATAKSAGKFMSYSIFKSAKELVYLPLSYEEKTQGKAVIDIMVYRQAKLLASTALLILTAWSINHYTVTALTLISLAAWGLASLVIRRRSSILDQH